MVCPECRNNTKILYGQVVCSCCGLVVGDEFVNEDFENERYSDDNFAGGMPVKPKNVSLGYVYSKEERNFLVGKKDIELMSSYLKLSRVIETESLKLWKECIRKSFCEGRSYSLVVSACIYLATIIHKKDINLSAFLLLFPEQNIRTIRKTALSINRLFSLNFIIPQSQEFILVKNARTLNLQEEIIKESLSILKNTLTYFSGWNKSAVRLGILFYLNKKHKLDLKLIDVCRVEPTTQKSVKKVSLILEGENGQD